MKIQELIKKLEAGVEEVFKSGKFQEWLKVQSTFHNYSCFNTMLIMAQRPGATKVAGYRAWQKLGRHVKKSEKGIAILAPMFRMKGKKDEETGETSERKWLSGFRRVYVFDLSQTEGKELPELAEELQSNSLIAEEIITKLYDLAWDMKINVTTYREGEREAKGYYNLAKREIGLKDAASEQQAKTFLHELAHALTHTPVQNYQEGEIIAEGTAYVVAAHFGLDTSSYSFEYVAGWASGAEKDALKKVANTIQQTANKLIQLLQPEKEKALAS